MTRLIVILVSTVCMSFYSAAAFAETDPQADANNLDSLLSASSTLPPSEYVEPAADAPSTDVIRSANGHPVESPEHAFQIMSKMKTANQQEVQTGDQQPLALPESSAPAPYQSE